MNPLRFIVNVDVPNANRTIQSFHSTLEEAEELLKKHLSGAPVGTNFRLSEQTIVVLREGTVRAPDKINKIMSPLSSDGWE